MKMWMWINDEASSSTLVEGLAPRDHKRHNNIKWVHEKAKLTIGKRSQRPKHDNSRDFALYGSSQCRVYKRKVLIYTKRLGFFACWQVITSALDCTWCARSHWLRSSPHGSSNSLRHGTLTTNLGFQMTWPVLDRGFYARSQVRSIRAPVR